jgi:excisionase family DNA binding protein
MPGSPVLATALVDALDDVALDKLADRLAPLLVARAATHTTAPLEDRWLPTVEAADYLGLSVNALHKLTAERAIPFEQEGPGCKMWFKRSELDEWRRTGSVLSIRP